MECRVSYHDKSASVGEKIAGINCGMGVIAVVKNIAWEKEG